ncbi:hypothetical protein [Tissierella praeacuta]|uniref:hypothetical protein n=1 Tax=Tissierella praeacuta TaxID=43131 RepID=UPI003341F009
MGDIFNREKFVDFYHKNIKFFHIACTLLFILNSASKGLYSWLFTISFIAIFLLSFICFVLQKRVIESILFGGLLSFLLVLYIKSIVNRLMFFIEAIIG